MHENKNSTVIENGKIKWNIFDSKNNQYDWELPIQTYESYIQNITYLTQTIRYSDGREHEIGEFSNYVETSYTCLLLTVIISISRLEDTYEKILQLL